MTTFGGAQYVLCDKYPYPIKVDSILQDNSIGLNSKQRELLKSGISNEIAITPIKKYSTQKALSISLTIDPIVKVYDKDDINREDLDELIRKVLNTSPLTEGIKYIIDFKNIAMCITFNKFLVKKDIPSRLSNILQSDSKLSFYIMDDTILDINSSVFKLDTDIPPLFIQK